MHLRILFITRKFPPSKGGMERVAFELYKHLSEISDVELIKWGKSNNWLPLVFPYFLFKAFWILMTKKVDVIYLQDGLLSPLGVVLKIFRKPVAITIHGLDITYKKRIYQFVIPGCVKRLSRVICISNATKQECIRRGIPESRIVVIPNGISDDFYIDEDKAVLRQRLERKYNLSLADKKILLSVGRLVERKGFHWFIEEVMPELTKKRNDVVYIIAGEGSFRNRIEEAIHRSGMKNHVLMLGKVDNETLKLLYNSSDILVMPNVPVEGDMEGFGVVSLEAGSCGLPVVASDLEGIQDVIEDGVNGYLVKTEKSDKFCEVILGILVTESKKLNMKITSREFVINNYNWDRIAGKYLKIFKRLYEN